MNALAVVGLLGLGLADAASSSAASAGDTCSSLKTAYKANACCGHPTTVTNYTLGGPNTQVVPKIPKTTSNFLASSLNSCAAAKLYDNVPNHAFAGAGFSPNGTGYFNNVNCTINGVMASVEQAGANVTLGYTGAIDAAGSGRFPINTTYLEAGLCPVNVHWHLGTEHYSAGEYDENGKGPDYRRRLAGGEIRKGFQCMHFDPYDPKFTTEYDW